MTLRFRPYLSFALVLSAAACSGSAITPRFAPAAPPAWRPSETPAKMTIGGVINTKTFVISANQYVTVTKNLIVFATNSASIEGTLVLPAGISAAFFAPSFTIKAPSGFIFAAANKHYLGHVDDVVSACTIDVQNSTMWQIPGGDNLALTASSKSTRAHPCTVIIGSKKNAATKNQTLVMEPGPTGGTYPHRYTGGNGGWIEIGSPEAITYTQTLAKKNGHSFKAFAPSLLTLSSQLAAGNGGNGRDDLEGTLSGLVWTFTPYAGGIGGSIEIAGGKIAGRVPHILAGNGGNGGTAGQSFYAPGAPYPLNGTSSEPDGISAIINMGSGGGGGGIFVTSKAPSNVWERAGNGGNPSKVLLPGPGGGCCSVVPTSPITGTGNGGSLTLNLAAPGLHGPHGNNKPSRPKNGKYSAMRFSGGAGTAWINTNYAGPGTSAQGGYGGSLIVNAPPHIAIASLGSYKLKIQVLDFGNGGYSMSECLPNPPSPAGLNGGNAGLLHDNGLAQYISAYGGNWGFNGGSGSNGTPPGNGAKAGTNDEGVVLGLDGQNGVVC